jgi:transcription-repair coupling factor (superfamily II helicase)
MTAELIDRFGALPEPANHLLQLARLRLRARELGIRRLELGPAGGSIQFDEHNRVDTARILGLIQRQAQEYRLEGPLKLRITRALPQAELRFVRADALLSYLSGAEAAGA